MFGFLKKKVNSSTELCNFKDEENENEYDNDSSNIAAGFAAAQSAYTTTQQAASRYAKPDTYTGNRQLYDSGKAKVNAKKNLFKSGKEVIDPYTGEKLVLTQKEAKALYGNDWQKHLAESDHIKPLERVYKDTRNNCWNTTDDIKAAANSDDNICVASRKFNNPKRHRTNDEFVGDEQYLNEKGVNLTAEGKKQAIRDGKYAEQSIKKQLRSSAAKNIVKTGHEAGKYGAENAGITSLTMSGIMNCVAVIKGEKSSDEAIADTVAEGGKAAVNGYVMGGGLTVVAHSLSSSSSKFLQALGNSNIPGKVITAVQVTGNTLNKYMQGEITTQECLIELGDKGLNLATAGYSMAIGQTLIPIPIVGGAVGALVGSVLTSKYYYGLVNNLQMKEIEHKERERIIKECKRATEQIKAFREELEVYLESYFKEYKDCFNEALSEMNFAYQIGDADGVIAGANQITRKLGGKVNYDTVEQFKNFLNDDSVDVL